MDDVRGFLDACQAFFDTITSVSLGPLLLAVSLHVAKLLLRGRAWPVSYTHLTLPTKA